MRKNGEISFSTMIGAVIAIVVLIVVIAIFVRNANDSGNALTACTGECLENCKSTTENLIHNPIGDKYCDKKSITETTNKKTCCLKMD